MMNSFILSIIIDACLDGLVDKIAYEFIRPDLGIRVGRQFSCVKFVAGSEIIERYLKYSYKSGVVNDYFYTNCFGGDMVELGLHMWMDTSFWAKDVESFVWVD